jgi:hypothetical protein
MKRWPVILFLDQEPKTVYVYVSMAECVGHGYDADLCTAFPNGAAFPAGETLSLALTCTNGVLPEKLSIGDIRTPESGIPATVSCSNITPAHPGVPPPLGPRRDPPVRTPLGPDPRAAANIMVDGDITAKFFPIFMNLACSITEQEERW